MNKTLQVITICLACLLITGFLATPVSAQAGVLFVSPSGDDTNDCLTEATACLTINAAIGKAAEGATINVLAGTYHENVTISKPLTLSGAGAGTDPTQYVIVDGNTPDALSGCGIKLANNVAGITISGIRVQDFMSNSGICGAYNNNLLIQNVEVDNNGVAGSSNGGIYLNGPIDNVTIDQVTASNNRTRGIVIWNGFKTHITFTNNIVEGNSTSGIELQDGTASAVTATGNLSQNNADSGMAFIGLTSGAGPNLIADNTVTNNGRFGIEIKLPSGTGLTSGDGSIIVERNTVSLTSSFAALRPSELRDLAGIAVYRRGWVAGSNNVDIPAGVVVRENLVSGFIQDNVASTSDGFGIVVEGNNMSALNNIVSNNDVGIQIQAGHLPYVASTATDGDQTNLDDDYFGRGNSPVASGVIRYNQMTGNTVGMRSVGVAAATNATCNIWEDASGPTATANPGGLGQPVSGNLTFAPWLIYEDANATTIGVQLPTAFTVAPVGEISPAENDFRVLGNALTCVTSGQTVTLSGTFDWSKPMAFASWALGADGDTSKTLDNYWLVGPANTNDVTVTATSLGSATIQGPGDVPEVDREGFFGLYSETSSTNHNWSISNLQIYDFDTSLTFYYGGGANQFYGLTLDNNHLRLATDLNAVDAPTDSFQNIGIHLAYGKDQTISNNVIDLPGNGMGTPDPGDSETILYPAEIALQSNTHGGDSYDGLRIIDNTINVLHAQSARPTIIRGIWENGHAHTSDVLVSGNTFNNLDAANDPTTNTQIAFRVTSHSGATTTVTWANNTATGANTGYHWLDTGATVAPVQFTNNVSNDSAIGIQMGTNGKAAIDHFTYTGPDRTTGSIGVKIVDNSQASITSSSIRGAETGVNIASADAAVNPITLTIFGDNTTAVNNLSATQLSAENNWWGCNEGPGETGCDALVGPVDFDPWLIFGLSADPADIASGGITTLTAVLEENSDGTAVDPTDLIWTGLTVNFTADEGTFDPAIVDLLNGVAETEWTHVSAENKGFSVSGTLDGETITLTITIRPLMIFLPLIFR